MPDMNKRALIGASLLVPLATSLRASKTGGSGKGGAEQASPYHLPMAPGPFQPTPSSLKHYIAPDWFRDAKFGIWAHWGPQAVPRAGDWYARQMYIYGHPQYFHHLEHYGHPSKSGYKDIIPLWKAERFDPDALMTAYRDAGAKYFVSMGVHHDNFDLWRSKHHRWNAVDMGPKRDIVGDWQRAALKHGLRFGVSEHLGPSYSWFYTSHEYDQVAPLGGVPYDGADLRHQDLYHPDHNEPFRWGKTWYAQNPAWHQEWFNRICDLIDSYRPDFLYTDGGLPFGIVGRTMLAHFYNQNRAQHGGLLEAVYAYKDLGTGEFYREAGVQDVERGVLEEISSIPWQTDTSIGDWFYSDGYKYKTTPEVIAMLADVVSKNGNLLVNVVLYADGSLPPESQRFLTEMANWMRINGEAIHGTRPWKIFGEGPTKIIPGAFKEGAAYTSRDIRFTIRDDVLYATILDQPTNIITIRSLGRTAGYEQRAVASVSLLGGGALVFDQADQALTVRLPRLPAATYPASLKIQFKPA